jgi:hypothetical protein
MNQTPEREKEGNKIKRTTNFFLKSFERFEIDSKKYRLKDITEVEFECLGYGVF